MYSRMEYLHKCFNKTTGWNTDNIFDNILATSDALLDFQVPNGAKLEISSQASPHLALSMTLSNRQAVTGSLAYLCSSVPIKNAIGTRDISLQDAIAGFRLIRPTPIWETSLRSKNVASGDYLMYGKMYFPGSALEAMAITRINPTLQLLIKCISNPQLHKSGTMIMYLQKNTPRFSREFIFSTNETLLGFRCLYNLGEQTDKTRTTTMSLNFDNSVTSIGAELWFAALSMSPGLSAAFRHSTRSTSTGKPLTMTLTCNPILGHISLTYNVKTSVSSTVCSKYDFNWYLYASNLSMGFELYSFSKKSPFFSSTQNRSQSSIHYDTLAPTADPEILAHSVTNNAQSFQPQSRQSEPLFPKRSAAAAKYNETKSQEVVNAFQNLVRESSFSSVIKASTSLNDRMLKLLWISRYKDFLISTGVSLSLNSETAVPELGRVGVSFTYGC